MYSLGATLYHAMTGHVPFDAPTVEEVIVAQVQTPLTPPNLVVPEITQPTSDALVRALAKNPADRFLSYDEFRMALEAARSQLLVQTIPRGAADQTQEPDQLVETVNKKGGRCRPPESNQTGRINSRWSFRLRFFAGLGAEMHRHGVQLAVLGFLVSRRAPVHPPRRPTTSPACRCCRFSFRT